jgi:hypothetical protein
MAKGSSNGGIGGSGVFGLLGTTVQCDAEDRSVYCMFAKGMNILVWILMLVALLYVAKQYLLKK